VFLKYKLSVCGKYVNTVAPGALNGASCNHSAGTPPGLILAVDAKPTIFIERGPQLVDAMERTQHTHI
jgi:hypothetical protein